MEKKICMKKKLCKKKNGCHKLIMYKFIYFPYFISISKQTSESSK